MKWQVNNSVRSCSFCDVCETTEVNLRLETCSNSTEAEMHLKIRLLKNEKTREHNLYLIKHLMEAFTKMVQLFKPWTIFAKRSIVYLLRSKKIVKVFRIKFLWITSWRLVIWNEVHSIYNRMSEAFFKLRNFQKVTHIVFKIF